MKPDHFWFFARFKMTIYGVPNVGTQSGKVVSFCKDRLPESSCRITALDSVLDQKYDLIHKHGLYQNCEEANRGIFPWFDRTLSACRLR